MPTKARGMDSPGTGVTGSVVSLLTSTLRTDFHPSVKTVSPFDTSKSSLQPSVIFLGGDFGDIRSFWALI